jgi:hypothetical protein
VNKKQFILTYRFGFAVLVTAAVVAQLAHSLQFVQSFSIVNFFSYFTIESNLFAVVTFMMSGYFLYKKKKDPQLESLRGAATLYMLITGIVYNLLLSGISVDNTVVWSNDVIHRVFPLVVLFDWLFVPAIRKFKVKQALLWLIYPLAYAAYCLIRGPFARHWYPYSFINVIQHGYGRVVLNCAVMAVGAVVLALALVRLPTFSKRK